MPNAIGNSSLSYNSYLGLYMLVNDSNMGGGVSCGIYFHRIGGFSVVVNIGGGYRTFGLPMILG